MASAAPTPRAPDPSLTAPPPAPLAPPVSALGPGGYSRTVEIRLALSAAAARTLSEPRVRRLVEIEAENFAVLAPGADGPLGDHVASAWIDQPTPAKLLVEVRVGDRPVERREIAVRGLAADVAARLAAIAVSEMVRAGMAPKPVPLPPASRPAAPTADEVERASRSAPALMLGPAGSVVALPATAGVLGGPSLALGFRQFGASESLFGRWLTGTARGTDLRWLEVGLLVDYRFWLSRSWRLALGAQAAVASVHLADALGVDGQAGERETYSARAGGVVSVEAQIGPSIWIALNAEPGAILRPVHFMSATSAMGNVEGAWLGLGLAFHFEHVHLPESASK